MGNDFRIGDKVEKHLPVVRKNFNLGERSTIKNLDLFDWTSAETNFKLKGKFRRKEEREF